MTTWWLGGGFPMFFVGLVGLWTLLQSTRFALAPLPGQAVAIAAAMGTLLLAGFAGFLVDLTAVCTQVPQHPEWHADLALVLLTGLGESLAPLLLATAFATGASTLLTIGLRRRT